MSKNSPVGRMVLMASIGLSAIASTFFNFRLSHGIVVNLSIVPLTLGFFVLSWRLGNVIVLFYVLSQIVASTVILSHGHFTYVALHTVLTLLPKPLLVLALYAVMMSFCAVWSRNRPNVSRVLIFVVGLFGYTAVDYVFYYVQRTLATFTYPDFLVFVIALELVFVTATRLHLAMTDVMESQASAIQVAKLETVSHLAASVAHEIRNPMTVVKGFTQLMLARQYNREEQTAYLHLMQDELNRAEAVISEYLQLAKLPLQVHSMALDLGAVCQHVLDVLMPYAVSHNVILEGNFESDIAVDADGTAITQAVVNLVKNAIESHDQAEGSVVVTLRKVGSNAELRVKDKGAGIPVSQIEKLGQPYYSTKTRGTGLGLTLAYKVFHEAQGRIAVDSAEGVGTTFIVQIPCAKESVSERLLRSTPEVNPTGR